MCRRCAGCCFHLLSLSLSPLLPCRRPTPSSLLRCAGRQKGERAQEQEEHRLQLDEECTLAIDVDEDWRRASTDWDDDGVLSAICLLLLLLLLCVLSFSFSLSQGDNNLALIPPRVAAEMAWQLAAGLGGANADADPPRRDETRRENDDGGRKQHTITTG